MKIIYFFFALITGISVFTACKDDDTHMDEDPHYTVTIHSPNTEDKHVNDSIHIHVDFESEIGETVHHVNVRIYNKADDTVEIYNAPGDAHVHATSGTYEHHADFVLSESNGVMEHTDWILEAKVWGHDEDSERVVESIEFHVHPE